jgi:hypothetical protein
LKRLSNKLQPFQEVLKIIEEIIESHRNNTRVLEHLLSFAENQFGEEKPGISYRKRGNVEVDNWVVDVLILNRINGRLADLHGQNHSLSIMISNNMRFPLLEKSLSLLNPWLTHIDSNSLSELQRNLLLQDLFHGELNMAGVAIYRRQYDIADGHCQQCLAYSRKSGIFDEKRTNLIFLALRAYCNLHERQGKLSQAVDFAEECYNTVVVAYDPVHPQVQEAAGVLIDILISKGNLLDAERYAQGCAVLGKFYGSGSQKITASKA